MTDLQKQSIAKQAYLHIHSSEVPNFSDQHIVYTVARFIELVYGSHMTISDVYQTCEILADTYDV